MNATATAAAQLTVDEFRLKVRSWLKDHVPLKDHHGTLPVWTDEGVARDRAIQRSLWEGGIAGVDVPVEYGGLGLGHEYWQAFRDEATPYRMPENYGNAFNVVLPTLLAHASEEIKREHIPRILNGDRIWAQFLSEPSGGSDLFGLLTRAERDGDEWVLNGAKIWTTGGNYSDWAICLARTDPTVPKHQGLSMFVVPMRDDDGAVTPGLTIVPLQLTTGEREFCQEFIDDVRIPLANLVGELNHGWECATTLMRNERTAIGRGWSMGGSPAENTATGIDPDRELLELARSLGTADEPIVRSLIGEDWVLDEVQAQTVKRVTAAMRSGELPGFAAAILKSMSGYTGRRHGEIVAQLAGELAAVWEPGGTKWGNKRLSSHAIGGGTTEMQRNAIAERLLGLPRPDDSDRRLPFNEIRQNTMPASAASRRPK